MISLKLLTFKFKNHIYQDSCSTSEFWPFPYRTPYTAASWILLILLVFVRASHVSSYSGGCTSTLNGLGSSRWCPYLLHHQNNNMILFRRLSLSALLIADNFKAHIMMNIYWNRPAHALLRSSGTVWKIEKGTLATALTRTGASKSRSLVATAKSLRGHHWPL